MFFKIGRFAVAAAAVGALAALSAGAAGADGKKPLGTIGLVVTSIRTAGIETPHLDECPQGVAIGNDEIWWKSLSPRDRDKLTSGGVKGPDSRRGLATVRGPRGEDVCWNPTVVTDPPQRTIQAARSIGFNLDGTSDGKATPQTCAHKKFVGADSATPVDNQMHRVVGCIHGWRADGYIENTSDTERRNSSQGVILMQISGVQTLEDSPAVTVKFFHAADVMPKNSTGGILSFASYRIDGNPLYGAAAKGRIKNGVLTTEATDVHLPFFGNRVETEFFIRGLRLELKLTDDAATGLLGGYHDLENWWDYVRKMGYLIETAQFSCPALYAAAVQMADGYPDPKTGNCTALSVAYRIEAVRAFVIETPKPLPAAAVLAVSPIEAQQAPPGIKLGKVTNGDVLTNADGKTLYMSSDACTGACAETFIPMTAPWSAGTKGPWTIAARPDQTRQWSYAGQGVFTCLKDRHAGDITCTRDGWQPMAVGTRAGLPNWMTIQPSEVGAIVADRDGRTLYRLLGDAEKFKKEICDEACQTAQWRPVIASGETVPIGPFKVAEADGKQVWQYFGRTLYTYAGDKMAGQIGGHRFGGASVGARNWFTAITVDDALSATQPPPSRPAE